LVVGCGSIGRRHLGNLRALGVLDLLAVDPRPDRRAAAERETGAIAFPTLESALDRNPFGVIVATPTGSHIPVALEAARRRCHLFVEKPLSHSLDQVDELMALTRAQGLVTMVACNYRFDEGLLRVKRLVEDRAIGTVLSVRAEFGFYLPLSHPYEDYRETYPAKRGSGGGLLLDRTHELDYLRWIFGEIMDGTCFYTKRSHLEIETEDVAEILIFFESGVLGSVHLDYLQREYRCTARVVGDQGVIEWVYAPAQLKELPPRSTQGNVITVESTPDLNDMYLTQMRHFLDAVREQTPTGHDLADGKRLIEIILRLKMAPTVGTLI